MATSLGFATALAGGGIGTGFNYDIQHPAFKNTAHLIDPSDRPQMLNLSWTYDLPLGSGKRFAGNSGSALNKVIGGWQLSVIQNYTSGRPILLTTEASLPGNVRLFPVRVPGHSVSATSCGAYTPFTPSLSKYLNAGAFRSPAPFTFGNIVEIPDYRLCGFQEEDFGLNKEVQMNDRWKVRFGTLWQNAFNRHTFETLNTDINSAAFGKYGAAYPGRNIQFYARFEF